MQSSNVLIVGMRGLGLEIAKNVILAGVKSVTIWDPSPAQVADCGAQYYLSPEDAGSRLDEVSLPRLAELNTYVPVRILPCEAQRLSEVADLPALLKDFQVIVLTEASLEEQLAVNELTHSTGRAFIAADVRGLFASVFCDFGPEFVVSDATGEPPATGVIAAISREEEGVVACLEEHRHNLETGDIVRFREVRGMTELNGTEHEVKVLSPFNFSIGNTSAFSAYENGGAFDQIKQPKKLTFASLQESLKAPEFVISDFAKMDRMPQLLLAFCTLASLPEASWPRPRNAEDAAAFLSQATKFNEQHKLVEELDSSLLTEFAKQARGYLAPMCAVIGGMVAQEVLKACSAKFSPIRQHFVFDSLESLPVDLSPVEVDFAPQGSRYDSQIAVFGRAFQSKLEASRGFIVGSGAIGCEMVKLYTLMGVSAAPSGLLTLTDMDNIEKSNLNRQFLFRPTDVGKSKSLTAAEAAFRINPQVKIEAKTDRVGVETENIFNTDFFESLTFVTNALDNVDARKYMDIRCIFYGRPLLESGTLGAKGNTQVVIPHLTESYSSSNDQPEKQIPVCTLRNFPNSIEHTIEWAMDFFSGTFKSDPEICNRFLDYQRSNPGGIPPEFLHQKEQLLSVKVNLFEKAPQSFADCVEWSCLKFQESFYSIIRQLIYNFPKDSITSSGAPFWSGAKRFPVAIEFDANNVSRLEGF